MDSEKKGMLSILESLSSEPLPKKHQAKSSAVDSNWKKNPFYKAPNSASESYIAIDCEMVSTEQDKNSLARVSIINMDCEVLLDMFVKPEGKVVNYRTFVTGIRHRHLKFAKSFAEVRKKVKEIIRGKILVGHAVHHDLQALKLEIPKERIRDTQGLYSETTGTASISLQKLCFQALGRVIQTGHHSSVEDAIATMEIFKTMFLARKVKPAVKVDKRKRAKLNEEEKKEGE